MKKGKLKRHKWKDITVHKHQKIGACTKCGIERYWLYGDMQCWQYLDLQSNIGSKRTTLHRPQCEPERGQTDGFYQNGDYIYLNKKTLTESTK